MKISRIHARQILDSRGNPTVEADITLEDTVMGRADDPSGASVGVNEALELRDNDASIYQGQGVLKAVDNVNSVIAKEIVGMDVSDQEGIDRKMIELDGTENKSNLGANAILAVSMAVAHAAALEQKLPLYQYFQQLTGEASDNYRMPIPMMNIVNGGKHAAGSTDIQEFMIMPIGARSFTHAVEMGSEIFHTLAKILTEKGYGTTVGDEGGYAPHVKNGNKEALDLIISAVEKAGYILGKDIVLALDIAASELYDGSNYTLKTENRTLTREEMVEWISQLTKDYPIISVEDGLAQNDWEGWKILNKTVGTNTMLVGDDLLVTNIKFLQKAIDENSANSILVKLNQIGTVTETLNAVNMAKKAGWKSIISHRSGETEDTTISHLAVGLQTGFIKTGSLSRGERTAKYNELMRIEEGLGEKALYKS
ncbi:MAG: phosphopyruvate hydratase [Patescibacteria group bacterium]